MNGLAARLLVVTLVAVPVVARAHDGPPFPILSEHVATPYRISIWTDPDTTDDGSPGGQFWIRIHRAGDGNVPGETRATVTVRPVDGDAVERSASATPVRGDVSNQFAAVLLDREGRFAVRVAIEGPLGRTAVEAVVDATYDLRPAPYLFVIYLLPFLAAGTLWARLLARRRGRGAQRPGTPAAGATGLRRCAAISTRLAAGPTRNSA